MHGSVSQYHFLKIILNTQEIEIVNVKILKIYIGLLGLIKSEVINLFLNYECKSNFPLMGSCLFSIDRRHCACA